MRNQIKNYKADIVSLKEKLVEKDNSLRQMKLKINEMTERFNSILEEKNDLETKLDRMPETIQKQM